MDLRAAVCSAYGRLASAPSRPSSNAHDANSFSAGEPAQSRTALAPLSDGLFARISASESTAMTSHRPASCSGGLWRTFECRRVRQRTPTNGRQGKSAASGRAHMVGRLEFCAPSGRRAGWRFSSKPQRFQCSDRRRLLVEPAPRHEPPRRRLPHPARAHPRQPRGARRPKSFVGEVMRAAKKAGHIGQSFGRRQAPARAARASAAAGAPRSRCRCPRPRGAS